MSDLKRQVKLLEGKNTNYMQQCMELEEVLFFLSYLVKMQCFFLFFLIVSPNTNPCVPFNLRYSQLTSSIDFLFIQ